MSSTNWGLTIRDGYGQTETSAIIANTVGAPLKPGSMGRPCRVCPWYWWIRSAGISMVPVRKAKSVSTSPAPADRHCR